MNVRTTDESDIWREGGYTKVEAIIFPFSLG